MSSLSSYQAGEAHKFSSKDVDTFRAGETIPAGVAVQRSSSDPDVCEIFDGSGGEFLGIAADSIRADQDKDPVEYSQDQPVPVAQPGEEAARVVKFAETAGEGVQATIITDGTNDGQFGPASTATSSTDINHSVDVAPDAAGDYGALNMRHRS